ncbi:MAG TPA: hypothetical protein PKD37_01075 [Oligoflexia bacterium]|nr:hypothetical protein [Oligoflexia bacterium]HMP26571.1 hypothetical protein [Oligoflexia bacterium]
MASVQEVSHLRLPNVALEKRYVLSKVKLAPLHQIFCAQHEQRLYDFFGTDTGQGKVVYVQNLQTNGGKSYFYEDLPLALGKTTFTLIPLGQNKPNFFKISYPTADSPNSPEITIFTPEDGMSETHPNYRFVNGKILSFRWRFEIYRDHQQDPFSHLRVDYIWDWSKLYLKFKLSEDNWTLAPLVRGLKELLLASYAEETKETLSSFIRSVDKTRKSESCR